MTFEVQPGSDPTQTKRARANSSAGKPGFNFECGNNNLWWQVVVSSFWPMTPKVVTCRYMHEKEKLRICPTKSKTAPQGSRLHAAWIRLRVRGRCEIRKQDLFLHAWSSWMHGKLDAEVSSSSECRTEVSICLMCRGGRAWPSPQNRSHDCCG